MSEEGKRKKSEEREPVGQARLYKRHIRKLVTIANEEDLADVAEAFELACGKALDAYYATILAKRQQEASGAADPAAPRQARKPRQP